jgi:mRNA-degrading endonuclease HigB of HigAB toxin-antitoxin module
MRILSRSTLRDFWESHPDAEEALKTWYYEASHADWQSPADVKTLIVMPASLPTTVSFSMSKATAIG